VKQHLAGGNLRRKSVFGEFDMIFAAGVVRPCYDPAHEMNVRQLFTRAIQQTVLASA
jgi:hypothetical protein